VRNPFRNETDAFRLLVIVGAAGALVIAVTLLAGSTAGAIVGLALACVAAYFVWGWVRQAIGAPDAGPEGDRD